MSTRFWGTLIMLHSAFYTTSGVFGLRFELGGSGLKVQGPGPKRMQT